MEARANVCFAGEDIAPGKCLVPAGTRLDEVSLGLLACLLYTSMETMPLPKCGLVL